MKTSNRFATDLNQESGLIFLSAFCHIGCFSALRWMINSSESKDVTLPESIFIRKLARVQKLEINLGKEIEVFYVNVTNDLKKQVVALGMTDLFAGRRISIA